MFLVAEPPAIAAKDVSSAWARSSASARGRDVVGARAAPGRELGNEAGGLRCEPVAQVRGGPLRGGDAGRDRSRRLAPPSSAAPRDVGLDGLGHLLGLLLGLLDRAQRMDQALEARLRRVTEPAAVEPLRPRAPRRGAWRSRRARR